MADKAKLRKAITEILDDADLNTITAKKVRLQLEKDLEIDLAERKKEIDELVMEILEEKKEDKAESEEESSEEEKKPAKGRRAPKRGKDSDSDKESEDEYVPKGKKKGRKAAAGSDSGEDWGKKKKGGGGAKSAAPKKGGGTGYTKTCKLSTELAAVMGEEAMARHEVVKRMWAIIKEKNLYDPKNKQFAICNEELLKVFGVKRFRTFGMMKYLKNHFVD